MHLAASYPIPSGTRGIHTTSLILTFITWLRLYGPGCSPVTLLFFPLYTLLFGGESLRPAQWGRGRKGERINIRLLEERVCKYIIWDLPLRIFLVSPPFIAFFQSFMSVHAHGYLFYTLDYTPIFLFVLAIPRFSKQYINNYVSCT